jgi:hypothetical protein
MHAHVFERSQSTLECADIFWRMEIDAGRRLHRFDYGIP